jgi:hypothetical protein
MMRGLVNATYAATAERDLMLRAVTGTVTCALTGAVAGVTAAGTTAREGATGVCVTGSA